MSMTDWFKEQMDQQSIGDFYNERYNVPYTSEKGKKTFTIEHRYIGPPSTWYEWNRDWHTYRKYRTEKDMLKGFKAAVNRASRSPYGYHHRWEYRLSSNCHI